MTNKQLNTFALTLFATTMISSLILVIMTVKNPVLFTGGFMIFVANLIMFLIGMKQREKLEES